MIKNSIFYHLLPIMHYLLYTTYYTLLNAQSLQIHINRTLAHSAVVLFDEVVYHIGCNMKWEFDHQCVLFLE